ncbi:hypothetical protein [Fibrella forsythiae]|uniref:Uncharacterized protein n=1 Tax=Fibrella forsythiae TaxID=2817061 RepID=A0ABS3JLM0_9BACT|nr:hypothetical protein [Fibrella forsythiae]MBO0950902.1 hypothetical protein [Fibrella forsythiae]
MKILVSTLLFFLLCGNRTNAQNQHLVTVAELKELVQCPDQNCFLALVNPWGFKYKSNKKGKLNKQEGTHYRYVRPYPNPLFAEATASYWIMVDNTRQVVFSSDNKDWIASLDNAIRAGGFVSVESKSTLTTTEEQYQFNENGRVWQLHRSKLDLMADSGTTTLTIRYDGTPVNASSVPGTGIQSAGQTVPPRSAGSAVPRLGGDWDRNYPQQNAGELLNAERSYAADYDRKHGKTGQTFFRVEKVSLQATVTNQYRPLTDDRWARSFDLPIRRTGFDAVANDRVRLFRQEALFEVAGERIWMPVQEVLLQTLPKETKPGQLVTLYALLVSYHDFGGTLHLSFLVNEFAAAAAAQVVAEESPYAHLIKESPSITNSTGSRLPGTTDCGFNWKPWSSVSAVEKGQMKRVMVSKYEEPNMSLLQYITDELTKGHKIQLARHNFFRDAESGYVVYIEYKVPENGNKGRVEVYENLGGSRLWPAATVKNRLCDVRPVDIQKPVRHPGVTGDDGQTLEFLGNTFFAMEYAEFLKKTGQTNPARSAAVKPAPVSSGIGKTAGGDTLEELSLLLLKALKTNDKALWMRCMHPDDSVEDDARSALRFDQYRECLDQNGVTEWSSVSYSRMTHLARPNGGDKVDLTVIRSRVTIEFTYRNGEFVGGLSFGSFSKYNGRWLVWAAGFGGDNCTVHRNFGR